MPPPTIVDGEHHAFGLSVRSAVRPLSPVSRVTISPYTVEGFELNLAQIFIVEKVFKAIGQ